MRTFVVALIAALFAAPGLLAQIDPDPDGIGVYFDVAATQVATTVPPGTDGWITATAYLVATRFQSGGEVGYWAASVGTTPQGVSPDCLSLVVGEPTVGFNLVQNMPGSNHWSFAVLLGPSEQLLISPAVVLANLIISADCDGPVPIYLDHAHLAARGGQTLQLHPSSGAWNLPVAVINGEAPVAVESVSWTGVKRLYR